MKTTAPLTEKQRKVLKIVQENMRHIPPTVREVARIYGKNVTTTYQHMLALKRKGYL